MSSPKIVRPTIAELFRYFLRLGATGFGGPIALVGQMEREFVDRRRWVTSQELKDGLAFSQLAPGPLAAQLAIYLGWLCGGVRGATVAGVAFIAPSFIMVVVLAALYLRFDGLPWLQGAFYGVGAAAIAVIARSAAKLARRVLGRDRLLWALFAVAAIVTAWTESELAWLFVLCGLVSVAAKTKMTRVGANVLMLGQASGTWLSAGLHGAMPFGVVLGVFVYFASAGAVRVRQRTGDRSVSPWWRGAGAPLVDGAPVPRCGGGRARDAGASRDHSRIHRLSRRRPAWGDGRRGGRFRAGVLDHARPCTALRSAQVRSSRSSVR